MVCSLFKLGIVLLQHGAQVAAQILGFLAGANDDGYGGQFLGEVRVSLLHGTAARMNTVVETEVVDNLNKEQTTRRSEESRPANMNGWCLPMPTACPKATNGCD